MRSSEGLAARRRAALIAVLAIIAVFPFAQRASALDLSALLGGERETAQIRIIHVADLARMMATAKHRVFVYDANIPEIRAKYGVIPGARLLSSDDRYDVNAELPANRRATLVFYCTDRH
jgi:hypothetical protein